jgi:hypothetical protein
VIFLWITAAFLAGVLVGAGAAILIGALVAPKTEGYL